MSSNKAKILGTVGVSFLIWLILDILTKQWAVSPNFEPVHLIGNWFYLADFQKNEGIAFSIAVPKFLQIGGTFLILAFLIFFGLKQLFKEPEFRGLASVMLGLVLAGGVGNLIERITQGYVVDFIVLKPIPVFNLADIGITVGLIILFGTMLINESKNKNS